MDLLGSVTQLGQSFVTPFAQRLAGVQGVEDDKANGERLKAETARVSKINGSGPNDTFGAQFSPASLWDFITGASRQESTGTVKRSYVPLMLLLIAGAAGWWFLRRR